jgi:hypothetical protein
MALRLRRGTDAERQGITPLEGELIYTTDLKELWVGDGNTQGGLLVSAEVSDDQSPQLGGNLDLNGNDIVGAGSINIDGTITATGNINLGDGAEDNVIVGGQIGSSLIPGVSNSYNLGDNAGRWNNIYSVGVDTNGLVVAGEAVVGQLVTDGNITKSDSTVIYDAATDSLVVANITASSVVGNFVGSLFADSSEVMVDSIEQKVYAVGGFEGDITASIVYTLDGTDGLAVRVGEGSSFQVHHYKGTVGNPTTFSAGDQVGAISIKGYNGTDYAFAGGIAAVYESDADLNSPLPSSSVSLISGTNSGTPQFATLNSKGVFTASVIQPGTYADASARDTALPNGVVAAGMMVFLTDGDGAGNPKFQGNTDGTITGWVDLN